MEKHNKVRAIHSAMLKGGLPAKATHEHRLKERGSEPAEKVWGERWWREGQSTRAGDAVWDKAETWEPFKALDIYSDRNVEPLEVYEQVWHDPHTFLKDQYGGSTENKL